MARRYRLACWMAAIPISSRSSTARSIGYAYAGPYRTRPAYRCDGGGFDLCRAGGARRGIGRTLLDRLIADSTARGFRQMIAVIGDSAQTASIELHRAAGFRLVGTIENVGFKFGRWLDSVIMQRALGPGARRPSLGLSMIPRSSPRHASENRFPLFGIML